jgi:hypothetical protein
MPPLMNTGSPNLLIGVGFVMSVTSMMYIPKAPMPQ